MKYGYQKPAKPRSQRSRRKLNQEVLSVLNGEASADKQMDSGEIFNAYTGEGGLHGLSRNAYDSYASYGAAKKKVENGQFFTPPPLCELVMSSLRPSETDLVADLTCGMGSFFNYMPNEKNAYGCEIDGKAYQVSQYLYPEANLTLGDIREYHPNVLFDYVVGNPPYHLSWDTSEGETALSEDYYCQKAYELLKPLGIMAIIVPRSFLADSFTDGKKITKLESQFSFLGQAVLPDQAFAYMGVDTFPTKIQFWQKRPALCGGWKPQPYQTEISISLESHFHSDSEARYLYETVIRPAKQLGCGTEKVWSSLCNNQKTEGFPAHYSGRFCHPHF